MADTEVKELVVNTLTHKQFKAAQEAGTLSPYELYGTPDTSVRLPVLTPMWFDHLANDVSWLRADTFSWQSGDVYVAAYEHLTKDLESANRLFLAWVSGTDTVYTLDENAGSDVYKQSTSGYMAKQSHHIATGSSVEDERTGDVYTRDSSKDIESKALYTDTINGNEIGYYLASDGHKICTTDQESNISALYESTGVAWYYILDTDNKQFKLPRTKWGFTGLRDSVGGYVAPGLPNITGKPTTTTLFNNTRNVDGQNGAFTTKQTATSALASGGGNQGLYSIQFDASGSNPIYGASDTVQPRATQMYLYFYVGNFEQDSVEQTAGLNAELFNGKADVSRVALLEERDYVVETQAPTSENGNTWYRVYKSGWVEQGGQVEGSSVTATLPIPMADTLYNITVAAYDTHSPDDEKYNTIQWRNKTTTSVKFQSAYNGDAYNSRILWSVRGIKG